LRKVIIKLSDFELEKSDRITIKLLNILGKELRANYKGQMVSLKAELEAKDDLLELELYENDLIKQNSFYELCIKDIKFRFRISSCEDNTPHEITSLISLGGGNDTICFIYNDDYMFEDDFIKKFELKLLRKEAYFTQNQKRVFDFYVLFADVVKNKGQTIDICEKLDNYLGSL